MCEFISLIETETDGTENVLFLTDEEVFDDPRGRELFTDCRDNDVLGYGAIRRYYNLPGNRGVEREEQYLWSADLPPVIAEKVADMDTFMRHVEVLYPA